jgi:hypothetical protein
VRAAFHRDRRHHRRSFRRFGLGCSQGRPVGSCRTLARTRDLALLCSAWNASITVRGTTLQRQQQQKKAAAPPPRPGRCCWSEVERNYSEQHAENYLSYFRIIGGEQGRRNIKSGVIGKRGWTNVPVRKGYAPCKGRKNKRPPIVEFTSAERIRIPMRMLRICSANDLG